jgi:hypothetical protein
MDEYSPSLFSRTTRKSISPGLRPASGEGTRHLHVLTGRILAWGWNSGESESAGLARRNYGTVKEESPQREVALPHVMADLSKAAVGQHAAVFA